MLWQDSNYFAQEHLIRRLNIYYIQYLKRTKPSELELIN